MSHQSPDIDKEAGTTKLEHVSTNNGDRDVERVLTDHEKKLLKEQRTSHFNIFSFSRR
jgi:hypothetical protein